MCSSSFSGGKLHELRPRSASFVVAGEMFEFGVFLGFGIGKKKIRPVECEDINLSDENGAHGFESTSVGEFLCSRF